jgi:tetratricopeptide (TPR) repeat protein
MPIQPLDEEAIFQLARKIDSPEVREGYLEQVCGGDPPLRSRVQALLRVQEQDKSFLQVPAAAIIVTVDEPPSECSGTVIGPYKLMEQIGEGGMGLVFVAEQQQPVRRKVALKVIKPGMDTRQVIARFEAERQALALMDHPNIARVLDGGATASGRPYFVMELVKGVPITAFCDQNQVPVRQRLELFLSVCQAVQHAHQKGIIHRDIKPSNVLVMSQDGTPLVKVIDFGIAKAIGQQLTDKTIYTQFTQMVGTPLYMSPEQAGQSGLDVDTRSDIYSLGVLLYELLTGTTPFTEERLQQAGYDEMRRIIREEEPPKPSTRISTLGQAAMTVSTQRKSDPKQLSRLFRGELDWIVMRALEKDRNRRYETASAFAADLQRYLADEPVLACPPSAWYRFRKFTRRNRRVLAAAGLILFCIALLGGVAGWVVRDRAAREQRLTTQVELFLDDVDRFEQEQKWPEALAAARRAEAALAGGEAGDAIRQRFADAHRDVTFVAWLDRIQQNRAVFVEGHFNDRGAEREYAAAFLDYGIDMESLPSEEAVVRLRSKPALAVRVAAALEDWVFARRDLGEGEAAWKPLIAVARAIDPDPLRDRMRALFTQPLTPELQGELHRLAESIDVKTVAPATLAGLGRSMKEARLPDAALELLRRGQYAHPADFWLNTELYSTFLDRNDFAEAVRYASAAVAARPDSAASHNNLGGALLHWGKLDEANAELRKAIEFDPKDAAAHCNLGIALGKSGLPDEGIAELRKAIRLQDYPGAHIEIGHILHRQGKFEEEATEYREAIRLRMNHFGAAHFNLGIALSSQGKVDAAIAEYREAIRLGENYPEAHCNLGLALQRKGEFREALTEYREALRLKMNFPDAYKAHHGLGEILCSQGKMDEGIAEYREAIRLKEDYLLSHNKLGPALLKQGKPDEAFVHFKKVVVLAPNDLWARIALGSFLCDHKHDYEGAIAEFRKAVALDQKHAMAHFNLGNPLLHKGDLDGAIAEYRKAIALDPTIALAHYNLGSALYRQDKLDEAIACYRKAIELDPKDAMAHDGLGLALHKKKDLEGAIREFHVALEIAPKDASAHFNLANALAQQRKVDESIAELREAIRLKEDYAEAHGNLAEALQRKGEFREALAEARRCHELGRKQPNWRHPSAEWVREAERLVALDAKLAKVLKGEAQPTDSAERLALAKLCSEHKKFDAAAARFCEEAFAAEPKLVAPNRYNAACAAALAGCGLGKDADKPDDKERHRLRNRALDWLRADLEANRLFLEKDMNKAGPTVAGNMRLWLANPCFAGVRRPEWLAKLPEAERQPWQKLWNDVSDLLQRAQEKAAPEKK